MPIRIDIFHHFSPEDLASLRGLEGRLMSKIDDFVDHFEKSLDAIIAAATADLNAKSADGPSPETMARAAAIQTKLDAFQSQLSAFLPPGGDGGGPGPGAGGPAPPVDATTGAATAGT